jgi:hypothetical protein
MSFKKNQVKRFLADSIAAQGYPTCEFSAVPAPRPISDRMMNWPEPSADFQKPN